MPVIPANPNPVSNPPSWSPVTKDPSPPSLVPPLASPSSLPPKRPGAASPFKKVLLVGLGVVGVVAVAYAAQYAWDLFVGTKEESVGTPAQNVLVSDYSPNSVVVTFQTVTPSQGIVWYGEDASLGELVEESEESYIHRLDILGLSPATTYFYKVEEEILSFKTPPSSEIAEGPTLQGIARGEDGTPAAGVLVVARVQDYDGEGSFGYSTPVSTLTTTSGAWSVSLANVWDEALLELFDYSEEGDRLEIEIEGMDLGTAQIIMDTRQVEEAPETILSLTGGAVDLSAPPTPSPPPPSSLEFISPTITSPYEGEVVGVRPAFTGGGDPGTSLAVMVDPLEVEGSTMVDETGVWFYALPLDLEAGTYTMTVSGNQGFDTRSFQVEGEVAPESGIGADFELVVPEPAPIPEPTPEPVPTPAPVIATPSAIPSVGTVGPTIVVSILSLLLIALGGLINLIHQPPNY